MIRVGTDFSGAGAFDQALLRLGIDYETVFACEKDKHARKTYIYNYGTQDDIDRFNTPLIGATSTNYSFSFPFDVYKRVIPKKPLDIYCTTPPCQTFSMAGGRSGEEDKRGILFYNSHEFIQKNNPRFFVFENVKGLLSDAKKSPKDDYGQTFQKWITLLGGKSVNGNPVMFPHENSVPYHVYWKVLNSRNYNVPQNRERVFIVGIRDDRDNVFTWPKEVPLTKTIEDVLDEDVDEKYNLSKKAIASIIKNSNNLQKSKVDPKIANALQSPGNACGIYKGMNAVSIGTLRTHKDGEGFRQMKDDICPTIPARAREDGSGQAVVRIASVRGRKESPDDEKHKLVLEVGSDKHSNAITTVDKDNMLAELTKADAPFITNPKMREYVERSDYAPALTASSYKEPMVVSNLRRLTPREQFRLMDFPDTFVMPCSDSQMYKQSGNSVVVKCFELILSNLKYLIR